MKRYILNLETKVAHDRRNLSEECNTDQIVRKRRSDFIPKGYVQCEHCKE